MPLIKYSEQEFPESAEVKYYEIHSFTNNQVTEHEIKSPKEMIFICRGELSIIKGDSTKTYSENDVISFTAEDKAITLSNPKTADKSTIIIVGGNWDDEIGNHGIFELDVSPAPINEGDPVLYSRNTDLDNHYHDCDEYWIIWRGIGTAVSENQFYQISAGDCIYTKVGDHHDLPIVVDTIHGIYFETTLHGKKRLGHLWDHTHKRSE